DIASVGPRVLPPGADDHRLGDVAFLDLGAGQRLLDGYDDDVAEGGIAAARAAEHLDALHALGAAIVGHVEDRTHLDHGLLQDRPRDEPDDFPALVLRDRAVLHDLDAVADLERVRLVVRLVAFAVADVLFVDGVARAA